MLFYAKKINGEFQLVQFSPMDNRFVPCPFRRLSGENKIVRELRRVLHNVALYTAGYSTQEYKGRTEIQARLSEQFEATHFQEKMDAESIYLVEFTPEMSSNPAAWAPIRMLMNATKAMIYTAASIAAKTMLGSQPIFELPMRLLGRGAYPGAYVIPPFVSSDNHRKKEEELKSSRETSETRSLDAAENFVEASSSNSSLSEHLSEQQPLLNQYPSEVAKSAPQQAESPAIKKRRTY